MNGHKSGYGASGAFYRQCAADGLTQAETARAWGVSEASVHKWAAANPDVEFVVGRPGPKTENYHSTYSGGVV